LAGIDVSKAKLDVRALIKNAERSATFRNTTDGHRALIKWLGKSSSVCVEATGVYHLQLCLALRKAGLAVMIVNPRQARDFAKALAVRSKTDAVDAGVLLQYVVRMPFTAWNAPSRELMDLRDLSRRIQDLTQSASDEKKRKHSFVAAGVSNTILNDVGINVRHLTKRIAQLEKEAVAIIRSSDELSSKLDVLRSITGIGTRTALHLLGELLLLDPTMTTREIVAYAGLDPREEQSGTSVKKPARISRIGNSRLRALLFLPAITMARKDPFAAHFANRLVSRGKKKMQAIVAVMRKTLHCVWTLLQRGSLFDAAKLFPLDAQLVSIQRQRISMAESPDSAAIDAPRPEATAAA
jgi:transposase